MNTKEQRYDWIKHAEEYVRSLGSPTQLMWEVKGPKNTDIDLMQLWLVGSNTILIQIYKSGGFHDYPSNPYNDLRQGSNAVKEFWDR